MRDFKISNKGSDTLFSNPLLERLTRTHFIFPVAFYLLVAIAILVYAHVSLKFLASTSLLLFPTGMLLFSLVEYLIHRFLFHFHAETEEQKTFKYKIHGVHHHYPRDKDRLVMPPVISLSLAAGFYFFFKFILGDLVYSIYPGFISGYSIYLIIHYAVHRYRPPKNILRYWWVHHSLHHYRSEEAAFSVSFPLWDKLFGTMPDLKSKEELSRNHKLV